MSLYQAPTCPALPAWSWGAETPAHLRVSCWKSLPEQDVPMSHPCGLPGGLEMPHTFFCAGPPFTCRQPGALQVSSPLWVAAFRLAAGSTAAGEAAPAASCSIPAAGKGREQRGQQQKPPRAHLPTPCPTPRLCHSQLLALSPGQPPCVTCCRVGGKGPTRALRAAQEPWACIAKGSGSPRPLNPSKHHQCPP